MEYALNIQNVLTNINSHGWSCFRDHVISFLRLALEKILQTEQIEQLGCRPYQRSQRRAAYANGFYHRTLSTTYGVIRDLAVPRLRRKQFTSRFLEHYRRRTHELDQSLLCLYLQGESCRDITRSLYTWAQDILSPQSMSRIIQHLDQHLLAWRQRSLPNDLLAVWLDGFSVHVRVNHKVHSYTILAALGRHQDGRWEILSFRLAETESEYFWRGLLHQMFTRGMRTKLFIHDGAGGIEQALRWDYPLSTTQRCLVHKLRNILDVVVAPEHCEQIKRDFWMIYNAPSLALARQHLQTFSRKWRRSEPYAVKSLRESWYSTITFFNLQDDLRTICRSTNMIEFLYRELRRRVKVIGSFPTPQSCERIVYLTLLYIENVNLNKSGNMTSFLHKFTHN